MDKIGKTFASFLAIFIFMSCLPFLTVKPVNAQTIPTPSIPEFTLKLIQSSYNSTYTDPYTGNSTIRTIDNSTIEVIITNQPFTPYSNIQLYYSVQQKPHFEDTGFTSAGSTLTQSNSGYTIMSIPASNYPADGQVDFEVAALIGYYTTVPEYAYGSSMQIGWTSVFNGTISGESNIETIDLANGSVSTTTSINPTSSPTFIASPTASPNLSPSPSPTSTIPEFPAIAVMPLLLSLFAVVVTVRQRRVNNRQN